MTSFHASNPEFFSNYRYCYLFFLRRKMFLVTSRIDLGTFSFILGRLAANPSLPR